MQTKTRCQRWDGLIPQAAHSTSVSVFHQIPQMPLNFQKQPMTAITWGLSRCGQGARDGSRVGRAIPNTESFLGDGSWVYTLGTTEGLGERLSGRAKQKKGECRAGAARGDGWVGDSRPQLRGHLCPDSQCRRRRARTFQVLAIRLPLLSVMEGALLSLPALRTCVLCHLPWTDLHLNRVKVQPASLCTGEVSEVWGWNYLII